MQNADLIISLGSRLDTKSTGSPVNTFARKAKRIMVEIDINELNKFKKFDLKFDKLIHCDLKDFFDEVQNINIQKFFNKHDDWVNQMMTS